MEYESKSLRETRKEVIERPSAFASDEVLLKMGIEIR